MNYASYNVEIFPEYFSRQHVAPNIDLADSNRNNTRIRLLAIAERPARRSVAVEILTYCCTNNAIRSRDRPSMRSTFSNCHVLFC